MASLLKYISYFLRHSAVPNKRGCQLKHSFINLRNRRRDTSEISEKVKN